MKEQELFAGFSKEQQAEYEKEIIERFGEQGRAHIRESKENTKSWTKAEEEAFRKDFVKICHELTALLEQGTPCDAKEVQKVIFKHHQWLKRSWTPTKETYAAHGRFIVDSDLRKAYEAFHPKLPEFISKAIGIFAENELA